MQDILTPVKSIRAKCLDCCAGSKLEIQQCPVKDCPLYPYRFGKSPNRKPRPLTEEQKQVLAERLRKSRENK